MSAPETNKLGKVSLEELLQLKRAERPAPEFWARFEQDLRVKQLAAIVEKRPWWVALRLPQATRTLARWSRPLPLGAAAVLALSVLVVREYRPANVALEGVTAAPVRSVVTVGPVNPGVTVPHAPALVTQGAGAAESLVQVLEPSDAPLPTAPIRAPLAAAAPIPPATPPAAQAVERPQAVQALGELSAVAFADPVATEPVQSFDTFFELGAMGPADQGALSVGVAKASRTAPASAREARLGRVLAGLVVADNSLDREGSSQRQVHEVLASALSDARGYDSLGRIGLGGDRLILKF